MTDGREKKETDLRCRAEALLKEHGELPPDKAVEAVVALARELSAYQAELQAQNEGLRASRQLIDRSRQELGLLYDFAPVAYFTFDRNGVIKRLNGMARDLLGRRSADLLETPFAAIVAAGDTDQFLTHLSAALASDRKISVELALLKADGRQAIVSMESVALREGDRISVLSAMIDITERKQLGEERRRLEAQLNQAQKLRAIGRLAGGIAHEFNNILAVIMGNAELILDDLRTRDDEGIHNVHQILQASRRARDLVRQILTFSTATERTKKSLRLAPLLKETVRLLQSSLPSTIRVSVSIEAESDKIVANSSQMKQLIINLATNAAQAMHKDGGALTVSLSNATFSESNPPPDHELPYGRYVRLVVSDTGVGMSPEVQSRLFEPFFTTREFGYGMGMGLSVVYGVVKSQKGAIVVRSEPGKGSAFDVCIPCSEAEAGGV